MLQKLKIIILNKQLFQSVNLIKFKSFSL